VSTHLLTKAGYLNSTVTKVLHLKKNHSFFTAFTNMADLPMPSPTNPPLSLPEYKIISFDVFGTLVEYKQHILASFKPLLNRLPATSPYRDPTPLNPSLEHCATKGDIEFLKLFQKQEDSIKLELAERPLRFDEVLKEIWRRIAKAIDVDTSDEEVEAFGSESNIKSWPVFSGTINALRLLEGKGYRLVALSNVDKFATGISWESTGLGGIKWAKVFTAEDFGSSAEDLKLADQRKFEALLKYVEGEEISKEKILHVAQSLGHDHKPAKDVGISSVFLIGDGPVWGKEAESKMAVEKGLVGYGWRCKDLREFAGLVEKEVEI